MMSAMQRVIEGIIKTWEFVRSIPETIVRWAKDIPRALQEDPFLIVLLGVWGVCMAVLIATSQAR